MYKLIIEDDEGKTTVVPLIRDEITIGRKEGNTIRLTERNVSRRHAKLMKQNGAVFIEDLQSYNGIKVNGDRIAGRAPIAEGDRIQIGDYQLALKLDKTATPIPEPAAPVEDKTVPFAKDESAPRAIAEAPTIPQPILPTPTEPATPARLVVVSKNFAGSEFRLDRPSMQIGRTSENDVVVNHRSISRHHAKVILEQGRYHVVDLGSANGVRVNGEEYGKVELRKGDLIDLGHVRLRFVAPGEDFVFARDAQVVDVEGSARRGKGLVIAAVAALVGVIAVVVVVKAIGNRSAVGGEVVRPGDVQNQVLKLNAEVDRAMKALDWEAAMGKADEGLRLDGNQEMLRDKRSRAEGEQKSRQIYDHYLEAVKGGNFEAAVTHYHELRDDSVYHDKAGESWPGARAAYIKDHLGKAHALQAASKCDEARQHVEAVLIEDEGNAEAQDVARRCGTPAPKRVAPKPAAARAPGSASGAAASKPAVAHEPVERPAPHPAPAAAPVAAATGGNVDQLVGEAQDDYVHGSYASAIEKARKANKAGGGSNAKAWRIIGASSCFLKDRSGAVSAWNKLGPMDRQFLKYVCQRNAITIP